MRTALVITLALAACGTESDEDRLSELMSKAEIECGDSNYDCFQSPTADRVASCMNDALANGARAYFKDTRQETHGYYVYTYTFTVGDHLETYALQDGSNFEEDAFVIETRTCTGSFHAGGACRSNGMSLVIDGCPALHNY